MIRVQKSSGDLGMTLVEAMVASAIFAIVILTVLAVYHFSTQSYKRAEAASDAQQRVRTSWNDMLKDLRLTGFDYNRDGSDTRYPDSPDEQIEYAHAHAITIRGNLDYTAGNSGREAAQELPPSSTSFGVSCCPIVTTGNDEIVTYALVSETSTANSGSITVKADVRPTQRDAAWGVTGTIANEETLTLTGVDLTGQNPPYRLYRYTVSADGTTFVPTLMADGIMAFNITYRGPDELNYWCRTGAGSACLESDKIYYAAIGGGDDVSATGDGLGRIVRGAVRQYDVTLVGLETPLDLAYRDPDADISDPAQAKTLHYRKFTLNARIYPPNLGKEGGEDLSTTSANRPGNVTATAGECNSVLIAWDEPADCSSYQIQLFDTSTSTVDPFYVTVVAGEVVPGSSPKRIRTILDSNDHTKIKNGLRVAAKVTGINNSGQSGDTSLPSNTATLVDVTRPEAPKQLTATGYEENATGYPDTGTTLVVPVSDPLDDDYPQQDSILLRWQPPSYVLDVTDQLDPIHTWTSRTTYATLPALAGAADPAADLDADTVMEHTRTPLWELNIEKTYLVFRSTDPRFVPTDSDFIAATTGLAEASSGYLAYRDKTVHQWDSSGKWRRTTNAISCCKPWYYRIRAVDACWDGTYPASTDTNGHWAEAMHLSPFYPALNPDTNERDSDKTSGLSASQVGLAIPGYMIPTAKAEAPQELRYHDLDLSTSDGNGMSFMLGFDAVKKDQNATAKDEAYATYYLYSHPTDPNFSISTTGAPGLGARLDKIIRVNNLAAQRIDRDDENMDGFILPSEDETWSSSGSDLIIPLDSTSNRYYRVAAVQCQNDTIAKNGSDATAYDFGPLSAAMALPCVFGGGDSSTVNVSHGTWPNYVLAYAYTQDPLVKVQYARLILKLPATGDGAMTAAPGIGPDYTGGSTFTFSSEHIRSLTQQFAAGSPILVAAEIKDQNGCVKQSALQLETIELPTCCLAYLSPMATLDGTATVATISLREFCNADPLYVTRITLTLGNENGGRAEVMTKVYWGPVLISNTRSTSIVIDRSSSPLTINPVQTASLIVNFDKAVIGDSLQIAVEYNIQGRPGSCPNTQSPLR